MNRRVLFISYAFPPVGGAGVQRVVKFAKYLPEHSWSVSILTVANPSVPVIDHSLATDLPRSTIIRKAKTLEPGYAFKASVSAGESRTAQSSVALRAKSAIRQIANFMLQPDPQILWKPQAVRTGKRLLRETPHSAIIATGPPFSSFLIGDALARWSGLPLLLDYRDEWGISNAYLENKQQNSATRKIQQRMQRRVVKHAKALLATTRSSGQALKAVRDEAGSSARIEWIYNGYDPDDFPTSWTPPPRRDPSYRLVYAGTLWNLTSVAPLAEAVRRLSQESPDLAAKIELVFAGRRTGPQQEILDSLKDSPCRIIEHPYLDHEKALELIRSADGLCVLLTDVKESTRVVPAKIFECMAAKRPILAIAPQGELWDILRDYPASYPIEPSDIEGIMNRLRQEIAKCLDRESANSSIDWSSDVYNRSSQAGQLAEILESIAR